MNGAPFNAADLSLVRRPKLWRVVPGAAVRLNSGGPVGFVLAVSPCGEALVHWIGMAGARRVSAPSLSRASGIKQ